MCLRDYQIGCIDSIFNRFKSGYNEALAVMSTGAGKGYIMQEIIKLLEGKQIVILFNRNDLLEQINMRLNNAGIKSVIYNGNTKNRADVICASVESFKKIVNELTINVLIIDETHNVNFDSGSYKKIIDDARAKNENLKIIGFTATPYRSTGYIYGKNKLYEDICYFRDMSYFVENKHLVPFRYGAGRDSFDTSNLKIVAGDFSKKDLDTLTKDERKVHLQVDDALSRMNGRKCVAWFCCSIEHAERVRNELIERGETASLIHSDMSKELRKFELANFTSGRNKHLVFITIVKEGFDHPPIDCIVLMRPTREAGLYVQVAGRGARPFVDKSDCLLLDYGEIIKNLGRVDNPVLNFLKKKRKTEALKSQQLKVCPSCYEYVDKLAKNCTSCDHEFIDEFTVSKNLTATAYNIANEFQSECLGVSLHRMKSKAGNDCLMIKYRLTDAIIDDSIVEFFVWNSFQAMTAKNRLVKLGVKLRNSLSDQVNEKVNILPKKILYEVDKKGYRKFIRCVF